MLGTYLNIPSGHLLRLMISVTFISVFQAENLANKESSAESLNFVCISKVAPRAPLSFLNVAIQRKH